MYHTRVTVIRRQCDGFFMLRFKEDHGLAEKTRTVPVSAVPFGARASTVTDRASLGSMRLQTGPLADGGPKEKSQNSKSADGEEVASGRCLHAYCSLALCGSWSDLVYHS
jgi:hypothetical protein